MSEDIRELTRELHDLNERMENILRYVKAVSLLIAKKYKLNLVLEKSTKKAYKK